MNETTKVRAQGPVRPMWLPILNRRQWVRELLWKTFKSVISVFNSLLSSLSSFYWTSDWHNSCSLPQVIHTPLISFCLKSVSPFAYSCLALATYSRNMLNCVFSPYSHCPASMSNLYLVPRHSNSSPTSFLSLVSKSSTTVIVIYFKHKSFSCIKPSMILHPKN